MAETKRVNYLVMGEEKGDSGTPHLQGYVELKNPATVLGLKRMFSNRMHVEARRGTPAEAAKYCKKDGKFWETGEISNQGARSDISNLYQMVIDGKNDQEIQAEMPGTYMRYFKAVDRVRQNHARHLKTAHDPVEVIVLYGEAGTNKTRYAYVLDPNLYFLAQSASEVWFDGYTDQKTILIDDFYGWIKYGYFLRLLDRYRFNIAVKGGFTWKQWERVIITSNQHPSQWYKNGYTDALKRRISQVIYFPASAAQTITAPPETTFDPSMLAPPAPPVPPAVSDEEEEDEDEAPPASQDYSQPPEREDLCSDTDSNADMDVTGVLHCEFCHDYGECHNKECLNYDKPLGGEDCDEDSDDDLSPPRLVRSDSVIVCGDSRNPRRRVRLCISDEEDEDDVQVKLEHSTEVVDLTGDSDQE